MKTLNITLVVAALTLAFSASSMAQSMSKSDHKAAEEKIEAEYKSAKTGCNSFAGNAKDICMAEAKGKESVAKAELEALYKPSPKLTTKFVLRKLRQSIRLPKKSATHLLAQSRINALPKPERHLIRSNYFDLI